MFAQKQHGDRGRVGVRLDPDAELLTTQAGKGVLQDNQFRFLAHQLQRLFRRDGFPNVEPCRPERAGEGGLIDGAGPHEQDRPACVL